MQVATPVGGTNNETIVLEVTPFVANEKSRVRISLVSPAKYKDFLCLDVILLL